MKKNYLTWNKDTVSDDQIFKDMEELSGGKIKVDRENVKLADAKDIVSKLKKKKNAKKAKNNNNNPKSH
jgi:phage terminase Nu1 subunit (DNA packaging protein)